MKNTQFTAKSVYVVFLLLSVMSCQDPSPNQVQPKPVKKGAARAATISGSQVTIYDVDATVTDFYNNLRQSNYCYTCAPASPYQVSFPINNWFNYMDYEFNYPFTQLQKNYIQQFPDLIPVVDRHVRFNGQFADADLITYMESYLQNEYTFITSPGERAILNQRSISDQFAFRANAINASLEAVTRFSMINCQDNACNAYRHALFNALNAEDFTIPVARSLGQTRESNLTISPTTLLPTNFTCQDPPSVISTNYMDLFNNEWGYRAFTQKQQQGGNLSAIVASYSQNGQLLDAPGCP